MRRHPVGYRYASALFEYAKEKNVLQQLSQELEVVSQVVKETNLLDEVFKHPKMTSEEKKTIVKTSFSGKVSDAILNLLYILVDKKREDIFLSVVKDFNNLSNEDQGIAEAIVYSAKPLTDDEKEAIAQVFSIKAGKQKLLIENVVDKEIIGGLKVRIGDRVYDGSVANKLERLQQSMMYGNVSR